MQSVRCLFLLAVMVLAGAVGAQVPLGVTLSPNTAASTAAAWVNVKNLFLPWGKVGAPETPNPALRLTPQGYPLQDAETLAYLRGYPDGTYKLSFEGTATVAVGGMGKLAAPPVKGGARTTAEVVITHTAGDRLTLRFTGIDPADPPRSLRLIIPGLPLDTAQGFTPRFLRRVQPFAVIRAAAWQEVGNGEPLTWANRVQPTDFLRTGPRGVAYEELIALANATKRGLWLTIPDQADDDYVRQLARLLKASLLPALPVYLEFGNEPWDHTLPAYLRLRDAARANPLLTRPDDWGRMAELSAERLAACTAIMRDEFGRQAGRVKPVLCGPTAHPVYLRAGLAYLALRYDAPKKLLAAVAIGGDVEPIAADGLALDQLFTRREETEKTVFAPTLKAQAALADSYGLPLWGYAGGPGLDGCRDGESVRLLKRQAQQDARFGKAVRAYLDVWRRGGGGLLVLRGHIGPYDTAGRWGLLENAALPGSPAWDAALAAQLPPGDATLDGAVTFDDFAVLRANFGQTGKRWEEGDFTLDGTVDKADFHAVKAKLAGLTSTEAMEVVAFERGQRPPAPINAGEPYSGAPLTLPGVIQVEDYNRGGEGVAYHDTSPTNAGGAYRPDERVDLKACNDAGGGYCLGWAVAGEWLHYTVQIAHAGTYVLEARVASLGQGGTFHLELDGEDLTGPLTAPNTKSWTTWTTLTAPALRLPAGIHVLRLVFDTNGEWGSVANFNTLTIKPAPGKRGK